MADKVAGGIKAGSTSVSLVLPKLRFSSDGTEVTGKVAADLTAYYWRQGGTPTAISLSDLGTVSSAYSSGGVKEADSTHMKGSYRLDPPDAAFATGADWVAFDLFAAGTYVSSLTLALETKGAAEVYTLVGLVKAVTDTLTIASGKVAATLGAAGDFAQACADKIWASAARTLTAFGFTVTLAASPNDELASAHNTAGTIGALINAAGTASDPLLNSVPGSYLAGTAGYALGNMADDSANVAAIKTKTDQLTFTTPNVVDASASGGMTPATIAAAVLNTAMTESYAADGAQATLTQAIYLIMQSISERSVSGTTLTIKKLDGSTTAATFTTNSATNPTSVTRTT
jgi:hypothetical protein